MKILKDFFSYQKAEGETIVGWNEELCGEEWCWIRADGDAAFHIDRMK